jgi:hypothetical protein
VPAGTAKSGEKAGIAQSVVAKGKGQREGMRAGDHRRRAAQAVIEQLSTIDPLHTTPLEALMLLTELKKLVEDGEGRTFL